MSAPELKQRVAEIEQQVRDVTDYLCSRGDTMPMRAQIEGQVRRAIHGLAQKSWRVVRADIPAARIAELEAENARLLEAIADTPERSRIEELEHQADRDTDRIHELSDEVERLREANAELRAALNKGEG